EMSAFDPEQTGSHNAQGCRPPNAAALLSFGSLGGRPRNTPSGFIIPCRPTVAGRPPTGPGWGARAETRRLCPGSGQAVLRDKRERGTARSNFQSRTNFVSHSEGVSYPCIFFSRI